MTSTTREDSGLQRYWSRLGPTSQVLVAAALLLVVYVGLSFLNNENGYLGTDTGGKVVTLAAMQQHHTWTNPDIGYWAQQWDPAGSLHPYYGTVHVHGHWVQVTSLPMIIAAGPLWRLGGYRLALLLPMIGGVLSAFAARSANRVDGLCADRTRVTGLDLFPRPLGTLARPRRDGMGNGRARTGCVTRR